MIGQNVFDIGGDDDESAENEEEDEDDGDGGLFDDIKDDVSDTIDDVKDDITDKINEKGDEAADALADRLGVSEWYSIHVMSACEGNYEPNATESSPSLNITDCTDSSPTCE